MKSYSRTIERPAYYYPSGAVVDRFHLSEALSVEKDVLAGDFRSPNPHRLNTLRQYAMQGSYKRLSVPDSDLISGVDGCLGYVPPLGPKGFEGVSGNTYNDAVSKLNERIRGNIDLSVDLLQMGETRRMLKETKSLSAYVLRNPAHSLLATFREFKTLRGSKLSAKRAGSKWLEFQYGWKPSAQTIWDSANRLINGGALRGLQRLRVRSSTTDRGTVSWMVGENGYNVPVETDWTRTERVEFVVNYYFPASTLQKLAGFSSLNPASIAWELTPYSFVVDWFVDVGGYLRNLESALLYENSFQSGVVTKGVLHRSAGSIRSSRVVSGDFVTVAASGGENRFASKDRMLLAHHPLPRAPSFKADLGSTRMFNAAALLSQHLRGR